MSVWQVLHDAHFHPHHLQKVQAMGTNNFVAGVKFCRWLLEQSVHVPHFIRFIFFCDECTFSKDGTFNSKNSHVRAQENPNAKQIRSHQNSYVVKV
jgi:hypothetical protein